MSRPSYCPNCGKEGPFEDFEPCTYGEGGHLVVTVYYLVCSACEWSGGIEPDDEIYESKEEEDKDN